MIPTREEIEQAWSEVTENNNQIDRHSSTILVPHGNNRESLVTALSAMRYLVSGSKVLIVGTNHFKLDQQGTNIYQ